MMNSGDRYILGIDIGASRTGFGLVSLEGKIFEQEIIQSKIEGSLLIDRLLEVSEKMISRAKEGGKTLAGIGIGSPGIVDSRQGIVVAAGNLPELFGARLKEIFEGRFHLPVSVENDVNADAIGEMVFGVAKGRRNFVVFALGTDLGGGIVIDGRLYRGANFIAAEFGHLTLDLSGRRCVCGGYGCAREYVSGAGIAERGREELPGESLALKLVNGERDKLSAKEIFQAWQKGDMYAERLVDEFGRRFGALIANVMKVLDPELVILGGGVCRAVPEIVNLAVRWTRHYYFPIPKLPEFCLSRFSKEESVLGPVAVFMIENNLCAGMSECATNCD